MEIHARPTPLASSRLPERARRFGSHRLLLLLCFLLVAVLAVPAIASAAPLEIVINPWEDAHQDPVLPTQTDPGPITPWAWSEYDYGGTYPIVMGHTATKDLPVMRFFASVPDGTYSVSALLWAQNGLTYRYWYGFSASNPEAFSRDVTGSTGLVSVDLGEVEVTDGEFSLYTRRADMLVGAEYYTGWGPITLTAVDEPDVSPAGAASGGGWLRWTDGGDKAAFAFRASVARNNKPRGGLVFVRHVPGGPDFQVKSSRVTGYSASSVGSDDGAYRFATIDGVCSYMAPGMRRPDTKCTFTLYVEDHGKRGKDDRVWLQVKDRDGALCAAVSLADPATDAAETLEGGSITIRDAKRVGGRP